MIVGAGFAGAATAWALARAGHGPGLVLERERTFGMHASGRNAAIARLVEANPLVRALAQRSREHILTLDARGDLLRATGGLTVAAGGDVAVLDQLTESLRRDGLSVMPLRAAMARARFPILAGVAFDTALWCPGLGGFA